MERHDRRLGRVVEGRKGGVLGTDSRMACSVEVLGSHSVEGEERHSRSRLDSQEADSGIRRGLLVQMGVVGGSLDCSLPVEDTRSEVDSRLHTAEGVVAGMAVVESSFAGRASSSVEDSLPDVAASRGSLVLGKTTSFRALRV